MAIKKLKCIRKIHVSTKKLKDDRGQMMIELCFFLPIAIIIAVIAINAALFFGDCAQFDRISRNAVRTYATSPSYGEDISNAEQKVQAALDSAFPDENKTCTVSVSSNYAGMSTFTMTINFHPTLFGMGLRDNILGVPLPPLSHSSALTVKPYKPGVLF